MHKILFVWFAFMVPTIAWAQLKLPDIFSNSMVFQQTKPIAIWGTTTVNNTVIINFAGHQQQIHVDSTGRWFTYLPALPAGGPYEMEIKDNDTSIRLSDVMVGEVWIASGQSNMEFDLASSTHAETEISQSENSNIRFFQVQHGMSSEEAKEVKGKWVLSNTENSPGFSAVAYYFAKDLNKHQGVAVGIIQAAWGGTSIETWTGFEAMHSRENLPEVMAKATNINVSTLYESYLSKVDDFEKSRKGQELGVQKSNYDDKEWSQVDFPLTATSMFGNQTEVYIPGCYLWFRNYIDIQEKNSPVKLYLTQLTGEFELYLNGEKVEYPDVHTNKFVVLPKEIIKSGRNSIAIRIRSIWANGVLGLEANSIYLNSGKKRYEFKEKWLCNPDIEPKYPNLPIERNNPSVLFNAMIAPLIPYSMKGVIWYQGEANTWKPQDYNFLFPMLINDWRVRWKQGYFPFLYVQLANFEGNELAKADESWAILREAQRNTLAQPNTGMAVAIDVGDALDIHPKNKKTVGERLYKSAQFVAYQDSSSSFSGPIYKSMQIKGDAILLSFYYAEKGLKVLGNELNGFTIAGEDGNFKPAKAEIVGHQVRVYSAEVANPKYVRYGWSANPNCNLYNESDLPASPFRTAM
ncbi:sialate O-acetylesterase [Sphingobacterium sp. HJSM2_6]|uniref:sialate O-acetylesterase n=1 Tax=Sphingobacterium sp. HJSM2_6 TaxID=3366264 RepID=UPI003BC8755E